jgi:hypothetical protein
MITRIRREQEKRSTEETGESLYRKKKLSLISSSAREREREREQTAPNSVDERSPPLRQWRETEAVPETPTKMLGRRSFVHLFRPLLGTIDRTRGRLGVREADEDV